MTTEPKLEAYLSELDQSLGQIPVSDRSDIIIEIKSHVLAAKEKNPTQDISSILNSLGEPQVVAKRYLEERGLQPAKPAKTMSMMWLPASIKWLVIGFLSFTAIIIIVISLIIWRFTPLISVDETQNLVSIGGGLIEVRDIQGDSATKKGIIKLVPADKNQSSQP